MDYARGGRKTKRIIYGILFLIIIGAIGFGVYRYNRPLPVLTATLNKPVTSGKTDDTLPWPNSGESAIVTAAGATIGNGPKASTVTSTASIAKLITIMTVLKKYPLSASQTGPTITIGQDDVDLYNTYYNEDGSNVEVQLGEKLTEYQMLEAMLLPSGNNIADSLAIWAYGSLTAYKTAATAEVASLGMTQTTIGSDASGFSPDTTSTAADLVKLGSAAAKESVIMEIAAKKTATLPVVGTVATTNDLLGLDGVNGLKTGTSDEAGNCFLFTATHTFGDSQTETFVGAVMSAVTDQSRFTVTQGLLDQVYSDYTNVTIAKAGDSVGTITSAWGAKTNITPAADLSAYTYLGNTDGATSKLTLGTVSSLKNDASVGTIALGSNTIPLVTTSSLAQPSIFWRLFHS